MKSARFCLGAQGGPGVNVEVNVNVVNVNVIACLSKSESVSSIGKVVFFPRNRTSKSKHIEHLETSKDQKQKKQPQCLVWGPRGGHGAQGETNNSTKIRFTSGP